ncbi:hypothetical protein TI05_17070 [Achromatium sp. WMS3]|nr:hypothetical protein TI05_17070 [Achromatium sp. WMS3]
MLNELHNNNIQLDADVEPIYQNVVISIQLSPFFYKTKNQKIISKTLGDSEQRLQRVLHRILDIQERKLDPDHELIIHTLRILANICDKHSNYSQAIKYVKHELDIQKTGDIDIFCRIGDLYIKLDKFNEAINYYQRALDICENNLSCYQTIPDDIDIVYFKLAIARQQEASYKLKQKNFELEIANENLKREQEYNAKLVQRYSHTLANTIFPRTLYDIAERIKKNTELKRDALLLHDSVHDNFIPNCFY